MGFLLFILVLIVVVLFVVGVAYIFRGYLASPDQGKVVPKENLVRMREHLEVAEKESEKLRLQLDSMALELGETKEKFTASQKNQQAFEALKAKEREYLQQMDDLQKKIDFLAQKADGQAAEALDEINALLEESDGLKKALGAGTAEPGADPVLTEENARLSAEIEQALAQIRQLEEALNEARGMPDIQQGNQQTIANLLEEKSRLMNGLQRIHAKIAEVEAAFASSGQQQQDELQQAYAQMEQLRNTIASLNGAMADNEKKMADLQAKFAESRQQPENAQKASSSGTPVAPASVAAAQETGGARPDEELKRLKAMNEMLTAKEKRLQLELTKSRAKAMGLEKICAEYKAQNKQGE